MNAKLKVLAALAAVQLLVPTVFAQSSIYQITGRVVAVDSTKIILQSNHQQWVILRNDETKIVGPMRLGSIVTIDYKMLARIVQAVSVPVPPRLR
jgi:hypothetical protein